MPLAFRQEDFLVIINSVEFVPNLILKISIEGVHFLIIIQENTLQKVPFVDNCRNYT